MMEKQVRKAVAILGMTGALTFGGAGLAHAATYDSPVPATTTTLAQSESQDDSDNTGLWGLAGLLGLVGLAGLKKRNDRNVAAAPGQAGYGNTPRV
jgi:MYXO-CTERM domain-containing protein